MTDFSSVPMARQITLRKVLQQVLSRGPISRAELARITGLSKQTMSEVFRELEGDGWVEVSGRRQGPVGRSATVYAVSPQRALVFGADVGGTKIRAALADMTGEIAAETEVATDPSGGDRVIAQIAELAESLADGAGLSRARVLAGTIGVPGAFDARTGRLAMVPNIAGLEGLTIRDRLERELGFSVRIGNDVNMAAKGEQWRGAGAGVWSFVFIALGTGIGMGVINENRVLAGARGAAGEISTLPVGADPYDSRTFRSGALETAVGSAAIRDRYASLGGEAGVDVREIVDRIAQGDDRAAAVLDEVARSVGAAILAVSAVVDPECVILGGSIGSRPELLGRVQKSVAQCMPVPPPIRISHLGSRAGPAGDAGGRAGEAAGRTVRTRRGAGGHRGPRCAEGRAMTGPRLHIHATADAAERAAAERIAAVLRDRPSAVLGLATGRTMVGVYQALLASGADLSQATTFNLDEYCDLPPDHPGSFRAFMAQHLFGPAHMTGGEDAFSRNRCGGRGRL